MKLLEKEFKSNVDHSGLQTFKQIKITEYAAMYQRIRSDGSIHSYEVFKIKIVKAGSPLPNGLFVTEDYVQYPGKNQFGKTAYSCKTLEHAERRFDEINKKPSIDNDDSVALSEPSDDDKSKIENKIEGKRGKRGRKAVKVNMPIPKSKEKFTMKNLMAWSGVSQPLLYLRLKPLIENGMVSIVGEVRQANTRGKAQILYMSNTDEFVCNMPISEVEENVND